MRHASNVKHFDHGAAGTLALMRGLATSLVLHGKIVTTKARAKELRRYVEPMITKAKTAQPLHAMRYLKSFFYTPEAINKVLKELAPKYKDRKGGYTRITAQGFRKGDNAQVAQIELV